MGPTRTPWRESVLSRLSELRFLIAWFSDEATNPRRKIPADARDAINAHLTAAEDAALPPLRWSRRDGKWRLRRGRRAPAFERASSHLDAAEISLLRVAPDSYVIGQLPSLLAQARTHLPPSDPRLQRLARLAERYRGAGSVLPDAQAATVEQTTAATGGGRIQRALRAAATGTSAPAVTCSEEALCDADREAILACYRAAIGENRKQLNRVRNFSLILYLTAVVLTVLASAVALAGIVDQRVIPLCFLPNDTTLVCPVHSQDDAKFLNAPTEQPPRLDQAEIDRALDDTTTRWDLGLVELLGLIAAAVASAAALRRLGGTSTPYQLPLAAAVLKLPTGALTAVLGLLLMRGGFVPGLSDLDSSAQILAWAVVFGYAQELFTRMIDTKAQSVLNDVGSPTQTKAPQVQVGADVASTV
ncbi:hypothetical protein [Baekduia sp. Peel2402]|uniref:hypothetical protein n=1 Tax=Baekduia sp. Peel2402 TaxID=3458296 RepID=UPI00403E51BF